MRLEISQLQGQRLLAQDTSDTSRRGSLDGLGMGLGPGADAHDIRPGFHQHVAEIDVGPRRGASVQRPGEIGRKQVADADDPCQAAVLVAVEMFRARFPRNR